MSELKTVAYVWCGIKNWEIPWRTKQRSALQHCNLYNKTDVILTKVKVTLVQALRLCTGRTACRGSRGIALPFHDHGTRRGWGVSVTPQSLFTPGKDPVPIVQEAGWARGPVWTGAENFAPPLGFDPWTVQPIASSYTDWAVPAHGRSNVTFKLYSS